MNKCNACASPNIYESPYVGEPVHNAIYKQFQCANCKTEFIQTFELTSLVELNKHGEVQHFYSIGDR